MKRKCTPGRDTPSWAPIADRDAAAWSVSGDGCGQGGFGGVGRWRARRSAAWWPPARRSPRAIYPSTLPTPSAESRPHRDIGPVSRGPRPTRPPGLRRQPRSERRTGTLSMPARHRLQLILDRSLPRLARYCRVAIVVVTALSLARSQSHHRDLPVARSPARQEGGEPVADHQVRVTRRALGDPCQSSW